MVELWLPTEFHVAGGSESRKRESRNGEEELAKWIKAEKQEEAENRKPE